VGVDGVDRANSVDKTDSSKKLHLCDWCAMVCQWKRRRKQCDLGVRKA